MTTYSIRHLEADQLNEACQLFRNAGWESEKAFIHLLYKLQPEGWLCAVGNDGILLCVCLFWTLEGSHARIARFVTHPDHRGRGIGTAVLNSALRYLADYNIGLSANKPRVPMYKKLGFFETSTKLISFKGKLMHFKSKERIGLKILNPASVEFRKLFEYDTSIHGIPRKEYLEARISPSFSQTYVAMDTENNVVGYGSIWASDDCYCVKPLYADDAVIASMLLKLLANHMKKPGDIWILTNAGSEAVKMWAVVFGKPEGLKITDYVAVQMYNKFEFSVNTDKVYSLCDADCSFV